LLPVEVRRDPAIPGRPVTGWQVEERQVQVVTGQLARDVRGGELVGKLELDGGEPRVRRSREPLEERDIREEHRQVCGKLGHSGIYLPVGTLRIAHQPRVLCQTFRRWSGRGSARSGR